MIQRPIFKPLYTYNVFIKILENTSFWAPSKNTRISYVTIMFLMQFFRPTSQRCPRFNLNLGMRLWPNFMTFQHDRPLIELVLFFVWWWCIMRKEFFSWRGHQHVGINPTWWCWILVFNHWCWAKLLMVLHWLKRIFDPYPYQILTSISELEKTQKLTK